jgi:hypothetical protein
MTAAGADPGPLVAGLRDRLRTAFPGRIRSLYLLGSRALGREIASSDIDLAVVFREEAGPDNRRELAQWVEGERQGGGPPLDAAVLETRELADGVRPYLKIARLLAGEEVLRDLPLKPLPELVAYLAHLAAHFIWAVHGRPAQLRYPLDYPDPAGEFFGYERQGIRTGDNQYVPGFAQLVNSVTCVATFRLAHLGGKIIYNKSMAPGTYARCFPDDPWVGLVRDVYDLGRVRWQGEIPPDGPDRRRLAELGHETLAFENEGLGACLRLLPGWVALEDPDLRKRARSIIDRVSSSSPAEAAAIAEARLRV